MRLFVNWQVFNINSAVLLLKFISQCPYLHLCIKEDSLGCTVAVANDTPLKPCSIKTNMQSWVVDYFKRKIGT